MNKLNPFDLASKTRCQIFSYLLRDNFVSHWGVHKRPEASTKVQALRRVRHTHKDCFAVLGTCPKANTALLIQIPRPFKRATNCWKCAETLEAFRFVNPRFNLKARAFGIDYGSEFAGEDYGEALQRALPINSARDRDSSSSGITPLKSTFSMVSIFCISFSWPGTEPRYAHNTVVSKYSAPP